MKINKSNITINELATRIDKTQSIVEQLAIEMRNGFKESKMTTDQLTVEMREGFKKVNESVEDLARMTDREFKVVHGKIGEVKTVIGEHGSRIRRIEHKLQLA